MFLGRKANRSKQIQKFGSRFCRGSGYSRMRACGVLVVVSAGSRFWIQNLSPGVRSHAPAGVEASRSTSRFARLPEVRSPTDSFAPGPASRGREIGWATLCFAAAAASSAGLVGRKGLLATSATVVPVASDQRDIRRAAGFSLSFHEVQVRRGVSRTH